MDKIVLMSKWIKDYENLDNQMLKDVIFEVVYTYGAQDKEINSGNPVVDALANSWVTQMKSMSASYEKAVATGKTGGRKKTTDDELIAKYANQGMTGKQIAEITGYNTKTIYSTKAWKERVVNSENNFQNSEKESENSVLNSENQSEKEFRF